MPLDAQSVAQNRTESIHSGQAEATKLVKGVWLREFASKNCGASAFTTCSATFDPAAVLPYHKHSFSEAIVVLSGQARIDVEGRSYLLEAFDCLHVPAGIAHETANASGNSKLVLLSAFAANVVTRDPVETKFAVKEKGKDNPSADDPENIVRFNQAEKYDLSEGAEFKDLFAGRFGAKGICGGYGRFQPGASLPCHIHEYDESITIIEGEAVCLVQGNRYLVSGYDTAFVPQGRPHRFLNYSNAPMAMIWVYSGTEPERTLVDAAYCDGSMAWTG